MTVLYKVWRLVEELLIPERDAGSGLGGGLLFLPFVFVRVSFRYTSSDSFSAEGHHFLIFIALFSQKARVIHGAFIFFDHRTQGPKGRSDGQAHISPRLGRALNLTMEASPRSKFVSPWTGLGSDDGWVSLIHFNGGTYKCTSAVKRHACPAGIKGPVEGF